METYIENMPSSHGNIVSNQFIIHNAILKNHTGMLFRSYSSNIAFIAKESGETFLDMTYWDYSHTTSKYRNLFLGEDKKTTTEKIKSGEYKLINLNYQWEFYQWEFES